MASNIEVKARAADLASVRSLAIAAGARPAATLHQVDTFFRVPAGRLKLRDFGDGTGELIFYDRPDRSGPKRSRYTLVPTDRPAALRALLERALGRAGSVEKRRELLLIGPTRVHLDDVVGLGSFLELEVVLAEGRTIDEGQAIARELLERLGIPDEALVAGAYVDLLEARDDP